MGGRLLLKLNTDRRPIANKYCEGKMKRPLKRELKDLKSLRRKQSAQLSERCKVAHEWPEAVTVQSGDTAA